MAIQIPICELKVTASSNTVMGDEILYLLDIYNQNNNCRSDSKDWSNIRSGVIFKELSQAVDYITTIRKLIDFFDKEQIKSYNKNIYFKIHVISNIEL